VEKKTAPRVEGTQAAPLFVARLDLPVTGESENASRHPAHAHARDLARECCDIDIYNINVILEK